MSLSTVPPAVVDAAAPAPRRRPRMAASRRDYAKAGLWVSLVIAVLVWSVPLIFMVFTSLKSEADIFGTPAFGL